MSRQIVLPSKRRVDIVSVVARFADMLQAGEEITSGEVVVEVFSGEDPAPEDMIDGSLLLEGTTIRQRIKEGIPGVIYQLTFTATTDLENVYTVECRQAVLVDEFPPGPIYQHFYFTSKPYPYILREGVASFSDIVKVSPNFFSVEGAVSFSDIVSADLREPLITYTCPPEGIESVGDIVSAELREILKSYTAPPEGIYSTSDIVSAVLKDVLIRYQNYPPEGITSNSDIVSAELT